MTDKQIEQRRSAGRKGGKTVYEKYGSDYMAEIGRKGAARTHELYRFMPIGISSWVLVGRKDNRIYSEVF